VFLSSSELAGDSTQQESNPWEEPSVFRASQTHDVKRAWDLTGLLLAKISKEATQKGAKSLVCLIPIRERIYEAAPGKIQSEYGIPSQEWDGTAVERNLATLCYQKSLRFIDPTVSFLMARDDLLRQGKRLYFKNDFHWNALGHYLMAQILERAILSSYISNSETGIIPSGSLSITLRVLSALRVAKLEP